MFDPQRSKVTWFTVSLNSAWVLVIVICSWLCTKKTEKKQKKQYWTTIRNRGIKLLGLEKGLAQNEKCSRGIWANSSLLWVMCILSIHRTVASAHELDFSSKLRLLKATPEWLLCLKECMCVPVLACWWFGHVCSMIDVSQHCTETATNVPNYKTMCENWQGTDEKESER